MFKNTTILCLKVYWANLLMLRGLLLLLFRNKCLQDFIVLFCYILGRGIVSSSIWSNSSINNRKGRLDLIVKRTLGTIKIPITFSVIPNVKWVRVFVLKICTYCKSIDLHSKSFKDMTPCCPFNNNNIATTATDPSLI